VRISYLLGNLGLDLAANPGAWGSGKTHCRQRWQRAAGVRVFVALARTGVWFQLNTTYHSPDNSLLTGAVTMTNTRQQFFRLSSPFQTYNYVVLTTPPVPKQKPLKERIWFWTTPFAPSLWGVLFASVVFSSVFLFILEGIGKYSDRLGDRKMAAKVVFQELSDGVLKNAMSLTSLGDHEAESVPGRVFGAVKALMIWICMASYLANLSATLANVPPPFRLIAGFDSFRQYGLPMCIRGISTYISAMTALYPGVTQQVVVGATTGTSTAVDVVAAVQSGQCAGAVLTNVDARYALNQGDPSGLYCTVSVVGTPTSSVFYYAYAFTPNSTAVPDSVVTAFSTAVDNSINSIAYDNTCSSTFLPVDRPAGGPCAVTLAQLAASSSITTVAALTPSDLAGLFAGIGMGAFVAILMAFMKLAFKATRARLFPGRPALDFGDDQKCEPGTTRGAALLRHASQVQGPRWEKPPEGQPLVWPPA
jgi:hypothetical protein